MRPKAALFNLFGKKFDEEAIFQTTEHGEG